MTHHRVAADPGDAAVLALTAGLDIELPGHRLLRRTRSRQVLDGGRLPDRGRRPRRAAGARAASSSSGCSSSPTSTRAPRPRLFDTPGATRAGPPGRRGVGRAADQRRRAAARPRSRLGSPSSVRPPTTAGCSRATTTTRPTSRSSTRTPPASTAAADGGAAASSTCLPRRRLRSDRTSSSTSPRWPASGPRMADASSCTRKGCDVTGDDASGIADGGRGRGRRRRRRRVRRWRVGPHHRTARSARRATPPTSRSPACSRRSSTPSSPPGRRRSSCSSAVGSTPSPRSPRPCPALVQAWLPGEEGGNAIADVLFGRAEPVGRLPVSMPRNVGQVPVHHDHRAGGGRSMFYGDYTDCPTTPLFPFGHGLTTRPSSTATSRSSASGTTAEPVVLAIDGHQRRRPGRRPRSCSSYVRDEVASVARPGQQLVGFARVELEPGEAATVPFAVHPSRLAFYDQAMRFVVEPGTFRFSVGGASDTATHHATVELGGRSPSTASATSSPPPPRSHLSWLLLAHER